MSTATAVVEPVAPATPPVEPVATPTPEPSWRDSLPLDIKADPSLASFKDVAGLAKSFIDTKKLVGSKTAVPDDKAPPEAIAAFRKAQGVPDTAEGYKVQRPTIAVHNGWDEGAEKEFLGEMHKLGAPPALVQAAIDWYGKWETAKHNGKVAEANRVGGQLHTEWGANYAAMLSNAQTAIKAYGGEELQAHYEANGMGNDPLTIRAWAKAGLDLVEAGVMRPDDGIGMLSPDEAKSRIAEYNAELKKLPHGHPRSMELIDAIVALTNASRTRR